MGFFDNLSFDTKIKILSDPKVKEAIGDGKISEQEAALFKEYGVTNINASDIADIENSYLELATYIENNKDLNNEQNVDLNSEPNTETDVDTTDDTETGENIIPTTTQFNGSVEVANTTGETSASLKEKLNAEKESLESVNNAIADARIAQIEAENEYLEKLKEAAEQDEELKKLEVKRSDKEAEISEQESAIGEIEGKISEQENNISEIETNISDKKTTISNLETNLNSLTAPSEYITETVTDENGETKTVTKKNPDYQTYLNEKERLETEIKTAKEELETLEKNLEKANQDLEKLEESKLEAEEKKLNLEEELADIDLEIEEYIADKEEYADIQVALDKYQEANATLQNLEADKIQIQKNINAYEAAIPIAEAAEEKAAEKEDEEDTTTPSSTDTNNSSSPVSSGGGGGGVNGSYSPSSSGGSSSTNSTDEARATADNNLQKATKNFEEKEDALENIINGNDTEIAELQKNSQTAYTELYDNLKVVDSALAGELQNLNSQINAKKAEIDNIDEQLMAQEKALATEEQQASIANGTISTYQEMLDKLNAVDTSSLTSEQKSELASKKEKLQKVINELKEQSTSNTNEAANAANRNIADLKTQRATLVKELNELNEQMDALETEIKTKYPDLETQVKAFDEAEEKLQSTKETKLSSAKSEFTSSIKEKNNAELEVAKLNAKSDVNQYAFYTSSLPADFAAKLDDKLGAGFSARLSEIAKKYGCSEQDLIGLMYSESGLNPQAVNSNGGATGLIQFMPSTATNLGTTTGDLSGKTGVQQLEYVDKYLGQYLKEGGNYSGGDLYTIVFLPAYLNREVLTTSGENYYNWNSGLDYDGNGDISKTDLGKRVKDKYEEALRSF